MKAIFLDRDGVINESIFDVNRSCYRPPWSVSEFKLLPNVIENLRRLIYNDYSLFLVTNQPDYAKGLVTIMELKRVKYHLINLLIENNIFFKEHYYCFHHPSKCKCECRKPSPYFLKKAIEEYKIDKDKSWMIGDRDKDIKCGKRAGVKTILIGDYDCVPDYRVNNIKEVVDLILREEKI